MLTEINDSSFDRRRISLKKAQELLMVLPVQLCRTNKSTGKCFGGEKWGVGSRSSTFKRNSFRCSRNHFCNTKNRPVAKPNPIENFVQKFAPPHRGKNPGRFRPSVTGIRLDNSPATAYSSFKQVNCDRDLI